jgi:hypothetical protein
VRRIELVTSTGVDINRLEQEFSAMPYFQALLVVALVNLLTGLVAGVCARSGQGARDLGQTLSLVAAFVATVYVMGIARVEADANAWEHGLLVLVGVHLVVLYLSLWGGVAAGWFVAHRGSMRVQA